MDYKAKIYEEITKEYWELKAELVRKQIQIDGLKEMRYELIMENAELTNEIRRLKGEPEVPMGGAVEYAHMLDIDEGTFDKGKPFVF